MITHVYVDLGVRVALSEVCSIYFNVQPGISTTGARHCLSRPIRKRDRGGEVGESKI